MASVSVHQSSDDSSDKSSVGLPADSSDESVEAHSGVTVPSNTKELTALVKVLYYHPFISALMYWALQRLDLENAELRLQLRKLSSGTPSSATPPASVASVARPPNPLEDHAKEFKELGRAFCALNEVWVQPSHLSQPYPESLREIGPWHPERYRNDQTKREGVVAELYDFVPAKFHKYLEGSPFFAGKVRVTVVLLSSILIHSSS